MRKLYALQHNGEICHKYVYPVREWTEEAAKDPLVQENFKPSSVVKYFGKPGEYKKLLRKWKPPSVVEFMEVTSESK